MSAQAMSYGDLDGGSGLGRLDGGTNAAGPAPWLARFGRQDPDFGGCGVVLSPCSTKILDDDF